MTKIPNSYFFGLDGWRGIAILGVIFSHSTGFLFAPTDNESLIYRMLTLGSNGVDLFFAISGFLICTKLIEREGQKNAQRFREFYVKRIFRILPLYLTYLLFLFFLHSQALLEIPKEQIYASFLFLQNYQIEANDWHYSLAHFWSLAVEEHFYLFFPFFLLALPQNRRVQIFACCLLALAITAWRFIDFRYRLFDSIIPNLGFFMRSDVRMDAILYGCIAALFFADNRLKIWLEKWLPNRFSIPFFFGVFVAASIFSIPFSLNIKGISAALLILATAIHSRTDSFLEWRPLKLVGVMSYSLYVWNSFFLWPSYLLPVSFFGLCQKFPVNIFCLFFVSYLSYRFLEQPMIRLGRKYLFH